eukprot:3334988-Rhodomonas_salina.3
MDNAAVSVAPRRKDVTTARVPGGRSRGKSNAERIQITTEMIRALANKPLAKAAKALGISETALKRACRDLGFEKWPRESVDVNITYSSMKDIGPSNKTDAEGFTRSVSDCSSVCSSTSTNTSSSLAFGIDAYEVSKRSSAQEVDTKPAHVLCSSGSWESFCSDAAPVFPEESAFSIDDELEMLRRDLVPASAAFKTEIEKEEEIKLGQHCYLSASLCRNARKESEESLWNLHR